MTVRLRDISDHFYTPVIPEGLYHDEAVAIQRRILDYQTECTMPRSIKNLLMFQAARLARTFALRSFKPYTIPEVLSYYTGGLRKRYEHAAETLRVSQLSEKDAVLKSFVKRQKAQYSKFLVKAPRMICPRDPRYGLMLAKYIKPVEARMFLKRDQYRLPFFAKYFNAKQRATIIQQKMAEIDECILGVIDAVAFDAHVTVEQLEVEHSFYNRIFRRSELRRLLSMQVSNRIRTASGIRLTVKGCRMSGDMNTSLGNSFLVHLILLCFRDFFGLPNLTWFDDGDDCILFFPRKDMWIMEAVKWFFAQTGHELTTETFQTVSQLVFCQQRIVDNRLIRDFRKVISTSFVSYKHFNYPTLGLKVMKTIAMAELSLNYGMPVMQSYFAAWLEKLAPFDLVEEHLIDEGLRRRIGPNWRKARISPVTDQIREQFAEAFDCSPSDQVQLESRLVRYVKDYPIDEYLRSGFR